MLKLKKIFIVIIFKIFMFILLNKTILSIIKGTVFMFFIIIFSFLLRFNNKLLNNILWRIAKSLLMNNEIIIKNKELLTTCQTGYIIISNHIHPIYDIFPPKLLTDCKIVTGAHTFKKNFNYFSFIENILGVNFGFIPYDNINSNGKDVKKKILKLCKNNNNVLVFPEGKVNIHSGCELREFKKGLFYLAWEKKIPILVTSIHYTDKKLGVDNSKNVKFKYFYMFKSNTITYYDIIKFIYPQNYSDFNSFFNEAHNSINDNLKKYN